MVRRRGGRIEKVHSLKCSADWTRMVERCRSPNVDDIHKLQPKYRGKGKLYLSIPCERVVHQQLFNKIHVGEDHSSTAISLQLQLVHRLTLINTGGEELKVAVPKVTDDLTAGEATDGNNHF